MFPLNKIKSAKEMWYNSVGWTKISVYQSENERVEKLNKIWEALTKDEKLFWIQMENKQTNNCSVCFNNGIK